MTEPMLARVTVGAIVLVGNCIGRRSLWVSARTMAAVALAALDRSSGLALRDEGRDPAQQEMRVHGLPVEPLREQGDV